MDKDFPKEWLLCLANSSSYSIILSPPNADRMLIHAPGCNATFGADDIRYLTGVDTTFPLRLSTTYGAHLCR